MPDQGQTKPVGAPFASVPFGDYLVFVDESGDHELTKIDPQYPVFVLLFCIIKKDDYVTRVCPDLQRFKLEHWGHDWASPDKTDTRWA